jgi:diguanylate cyclase (GGDEF)-like protein/PAS domain S-box-containing protein
MRELKRAGIAVDARRVETAADFRQELEDFRPHVILSDFSMPSFDGMEALRIASQSHPHIPFIFVSGTLGEEFAVRALKNGATDFVLKNDLLRLPAAVERAIKDAEERRARQLLEQRVRESQLALQEQAAGLQRAQLLAKLAHVITGPGGSFVRWSATLPQLIGVTPAEMPQSTRAWLNILHVDDRERFRSRSIEAAKTGARVDVEYRLWRADGELIHVRQVIEPIEGRSEPQDGLMWFCTIQDVTEQTRTEERIKRLNRVHAVLSGINSAIVRIRDRQELFNEACRIAVGHGGFSMGWIAKLNPANGTLVPIAQAGLLVDLGADGDSSNRGLVPWGTAEIALQEKRPAFDNDIERGLGDMQSKFGPDTSGIRRAAIRLGAKSVIVLPLIVEGKTFGILTLYAPERNFFDDEELKLLDELAGDISFGLEFIAKEEKVDYLAYYDALTGLPNRSLFFDRLTHQLGMAARDGMNVALVLMDLDRFRLINDTLGRQAGDALIGAVAQRIKDTVRDEDTVARVGADSFALAVTGTWRAADAAHFLEAHNRHLFGQPFVLGGEELRVSATAGVAEFPADGDSPEMLFANAEAALRKAKEQNGRFLFYGPEMNARVADSLRLENRLRRALENGEMVLWYQPKVDAKTRMITGFEALMRWQDPETGMVPPAMFIPLMEQTGLILDAGRWALSQVARDCRTWSANGIKPPRVAVNVSPIQLRQKDFIATVVEAAQRAEEAGALLDLEITESVIMENVEAIIPLLQTVRELGVEIAVDDFGTGYSSLAYIARLPIQALKIDRSFVIGMTQNQDSLAIVRSIISMAHSLRLHVIAEGVETEEQAALLLQLDCDQMQGYLLNRPVPPQQVPDLLRQQNQTAHVKPAGNGSATKTRNRVKGKSAKRR